MNEPGIVQGNSFRTLTSLSNNLVNTRFLDIAPRTTPPLDLPVRLEGNLDIDEDMPSKVYVALAVLMRTQDNAEICIGDSCITTNDNLIDQAVFSVSELEFEMVRQ